MTQQLRVKEREKPTPLALPPMTYEAFLEYDFDNPHVEWVDGEVVMMAPVSGEHQDVAGLLYTLFTHFVEEHDVGKVRYDPFQMKTGTDLPGRAPDVQVILKKNLRRLKTNHLAGPADLVVEVISPGSRGTDRGDKFYEYEKGGVKEYWLISAEVQSFTCWAETSATTSCPSKTASFGAPCSKDCGCALTGAGSGHCRRS